MAIADRIAAMWLHERISTLYMGYMDEKGIFYMGYMEEKRASCHPHGSSRLSHRRTGRRTVLSRLCHGSAPVAHAKILEFPPKVSFENEGAGWSQGTCSRNAPVVVACSYKRSAAWSERLIESVCHAHLYRQVGGVALPTTTNSFGWA